MVFSSFLGAPDIEKLAARHDTARLIKALAHNKQKSIRIRAAEALGTTKDARAVQPLVLALRDPVPEVRLAVIQALESIVRGCIVQPLTATLRDNYASVRKAAAQALTRLGNPDDLDLRAWCAAILRDWDAAAALGEPAVEPLLAVLNDEGADTRAAAARALGFVGDVRAIEPLTEALNDSNVEVRVAVAVALGSMGDGRAVDPLAARIKNDTRQEVRQAAAQALKAIGDAHAMELLMAMLKHEDPNVRHAAAQTLTKQELPDDVGTRAWYAVTMQDWDMAESLGKSAVEPLVTTLKRDEDRARTAAARTLGRVGDDRAVDPLFVCLQHCSHDACEAAAEALAQIRTARAIESLVAGLSLPSCTARKAAAQALAKLDDVRAVQLLITRLKGANYPERVEAAQAMWTLGDERAIKPLISLVEDQQEDLRLRLLCYTILEILAEDRLRLVNLDKQGLAEASVSEIKRLYDRWEYDWV